MVLNFEGAKFFDSGERQQNRPTKVVPLKNIEEVKPYRKKEFYFLRIRTNDGDIDLRFVNKDVCKEWLYYFNSALKYHEFL